MHRYIQTASFKQVGADIAAFTTSGIAGWTWASDFEFLLQLTVTLFAAISAFYAVLYHRAKLKLLQKQLKEKEEENGSNQEE